MNKKFSIQVLNKLDSEYIQKKAEEAGYIQTTGNPFESDRLKYLHFNTCVNGHITWSEDTDSPFYKFPSQAEEIVKLFEKEKEPEFKVGDWVIVKGFVREDTLGRQYYKEGEIFRVEWLEGIWCAKQKHREIRIASLRHATPSEIEAHLIKEAKEKGFVVGADFLSAWEDNPSECKGTFHFEETTSTGKKNVLWNGTRGDRAGWVYWDGKWAILKSSYPKIEVNGYKAEFKDWGLDFNGGCAKIDRSLFTGLANYINISGTGNKKITSVKIGTGEFTASQIKEIADHYNKK
jgi:hypothetical protein